MTQVSTSRLDDVIIADIAVDIDIANTESIRAAILESVPNDAIGVVIDLTRVRYLDSAGIRMLFSIVRELDTCRQRTAIALDDESPLRKLLKISNVDEVAYVCSTHDDCLRGLRDGLTGGL